MSSISNSYLKTKASHAHELGKQISGLFIIVMLLGTLSCSSPTQLDVEIDPILHQAVFTTPEDAANTFVQALVDNDKDLLRKILGPEYREVLPLDEVTDKNVQNFIIAWEESNTLLPQGNKKMLLAIGEEKWTLPIPIVAIASGWYFDVEEGLERMRIRRIGRNELATMQTVLAYYDAQKEYAEQDRNGDGILEYAQKFISTPGTHDGLYWKVESGDKLSPLGTLIANRTPGVGYHGYFYKILNAQGDNAKGGAYNYLMGNNMRAGFAIIAWPVDYGESGIMSFIVSHAGIVYEKDLGPNSASIAEKMLNYDPGAGWIPAKD